MQQIGDLLEILQTPPSKYENEQDSTQYRVKKAFKIPKEVDLYDITPSLTAKNTYKRESELLQQENEQ